MTELREHKTTDQKKIFLKNISDKGLLLEIHKEYLKLNSKKMKQDNYKLGQR